MSAALKLPRSTTSRAAPPSASGCTTRCDRFNVEYAEQAEELAEVLDILWTTRALFLANRAGPSPFDLMLVALDLSKKSL